MEQAREARDREQAEAWVDAVAAKAEEVADEGKAVVLRLARADIVFAPSVVKEQPISWEVPVMNRNAPSVERP